MGIAGRDMATSWANSGGPKFYQGTKHENPWNQSIHQRMVNNKENKFMLAIQSGTHPSQSIMDTARTATHRTNISDQTTYRTDMSGGSNFDRTIDDLRGFNSSLKDELAELKGYVYQTQARLGELENLMEADGMSARTGRSARSGRRSIRTGRSDVSSVLASARQAIERSQSRSGTP